jgi:4-diphosphocytidyl-2-C-methyl-D-erythritol kinase
MKLVLHAPAKINLFLEVKNRRPDGYHNIESIMHTVSLYDRITIETAATLSLVCDRPGLPVDEKNLAMKAAGVLRKRLGIAGGARITLEKRIPMGAGLGGGSSDAATVLKGLLRLWKTDLPEKELVCLAKELGADVPFFLYGGTAVARGIGEKIEMLEKVPPACFVLVNPGFGVATPWVYRNLHFPLTKKQKINRIKRLLQQKKPSELWGSRFFNRLEEVVFPAYPEIRQIKNILSESGCMSLMSGSGSTVFGLTSSKKTGDAIKARLKKYKWGVWVVQSTNPAT